MKDKTSILAAALCFALILPANALSQSPETRLRRVAPVEQPAAQRVAYEVHDLTAPRDTDSRATAGAGAVTLESFVPREGLQFYFEMRKGGLAELARAGNAMTPVMRMLASGPAKAIADDFGAFAISNAAALSSSKLALVGYNATGAAALIEAASPADAEQLRANMATLLGRSRTAAKNSGSSDIDVSLQGRLVVAGTRATVARLVESNGAFAIAEDQVFMKARERFSSDPFFAFIELGAQSLPSRFGTGNAAYDTGVLSALNATPYAIALGGSLQGDVTTVRALVMFNTKQFTDSLFGFFGAGATATEMGQSVAASFAAPDADIFVACTLDWNKLYDAVQSLFDSIASSQSGGKYPSGSADPMVMAEASLGFSIKNELIPALGNEVAVSLSGFGNFVESFAPQQAAQKTNAFRGPGAMRFMLMVALKDRVKFEKLVARLVDKGGFQSFARATYRNATVMSNKDIAFAVTDNFFMLSGSATNLRHALDAHALGNSLAAAADFREALGAPRRAIMQAYISSSISNKLYEYILTEAVKSDPSMKEFARKTAQPRSPVGVTVVPDSDGMMMEMRVPTNLTLMALASLATGKPATYGPDYSQPPGLGIPNPTGPSTRTRTSDGRRVPKLTDEDLRERRP
ncbi:MAG TPA: DUF3352 domain-containing protein [Blastocatellia bacterium]|nr:DUF3352 domain-containing protein [Blastocatellia bacterium]